MELGEVFIMTNLIIDNIRLFIEENHIKQTWIADALDTSKMNISNILNGKKKNISLEDIGAILDVLDLDLEEVSKRDFIPKKNNVTSFRDEVPEYLVCCADISSETTRETIGYLVELMDVVDTFKKAYDSNLVK